MVGLLRRWSAPSVTQGGRGSLQGAHPGLFAGERRGQLAAALDRELAVDAGEVALDRLQRHVQLVGDLPVRAPVGCEPRDAELARRERLDAAPELAPRSRAGRVQLLAHAL